MRERERERERDEKKAGGKCCGVVLCARLLLGLTYSRWERESKGGRVLELSNEGDTAFE